MSSREDEVPHPEPVYLSYGIGARNPRFPARMSGVAAVPSFTAMWRLMVLDYFGIFDGFFDAYSAKHLVQRLHVAIAKEIQSELHARAPRFLEAGNDVRNWWTTVVRDAFRVAEDDLVARVLGGMAFDSSAAVALVLKNYLVLANRGATRAVIYRGNEAVQLTSEHRPEGHKLQDDMMNSRSIYTPPRCTAFRHHFPEPEVLFVERKPRDKFLILATGSVWDIMSPEAACSFIEKRLMSRITMPWESVIDSRGSPTILAKELAEHVMHSGCKGDVAITIILFTDFWNEHRPGTSTK